MLTQAIILLAVVLVVEILDSIKIWEALDRVKEGTYGEIGYRANSHVKRDELKQLRKENYKC